MKDYRIVLEGPTVKRLEHLAGRAGTSPADYLEGLCVERLRELTKDVVLETTPDPEADKVNGDVDGRRVDVDPPRKRKGPKAKRLVDVVKPLPRVELDPEPVKPAESFGPLSPDERDALSDRTDKAPAVVMPGSGRLSPEAQAAEDRKIAEIRADIRKDKEKAAKREAENARARAASAELAGRRVLDLDDDPAPAGDAQADERPPLRMVDDPEPEPEPPRDVETPEKHPPHLSKGSQGGLFGF